MPQRSVGTRILVGTTFVAELNSIDAPPMSAETIDTTALDSVGGYRTFTTGFRDGGEITVSGFYNKADGGQSALLTAFNDGATVPIKIMFPGAFAAEWQFNGVVTAYQGGNASLEDMLAFEATIKVSGKPTLLTTESSNLTNVTTTAGTMTFAATTYEYQITTSGTSFTVTPTFASGTVDMYVDGTFNTSLTTATASTAVTISSGQTKRVLLVARGSNTSAAKMYELVVTKP